VTVKIDETEGLLAGYVDRPTLAGMLDCSERTVARYEELPDGLPGLTLGGRRLYRLASVKAWIEARERRPNPRRGRVA
jgi:hypothetical protein